MSQSNADDTNSTNLIVNYLPQTMSDRELYSMFVTIGPVKSCHVVKDFKTNYSYGYGFVNYSFREHAEKAIQQLDGLEVLNKRLKVSFARPSSEAIKGTNLYITNLPRHFTSDDLKALFEPYGKIVLMKLLTDKITGMPRGVAFVRFNLKDEAENAIKNLDGLSLEGSSELLKVKVAEEHGKEKAAYYAGLQEGMQQGRAGRGRGNNVGLGALGAVKRAKVQQRFDPMTFGFSQVNGSLSGYRGRQRHNLNRRN